MSCLDFLFCIHYFSDLFHLKAKNRRRQALMFRHHTLSKYVQNTRSNQILKKVRKVDRLHKSRAISAKKRSWFSVTPSTPSWPTLYSKYGGVLKTTWPFLIFQQTCFPTVGRPIGSLSSDFGFELVQQKTRNYLRKRFLIVAIFVKLRMEKHFHWETIILKNYFFIFPTTESKFTKSLFLFYCRAFGFA